MISVNAAIVEMPAFEYHTSMPPRASSTARASASQAPPSVTSSRTASPPNSAATALRGGLVDVGHDHVRPAPRELAGGGGADAGAGAGDHRGTPGKRPGQIFGHALPPRISSVSSTCRETLVGDAAERQE